jgi:hypothetical protein
MKRIYAAFLLSIVALMCFTAFRFELALADVGSGSGSAIAAAAGSGSAAAPAIEWEHPGHIYDQAATEFHVSVGAGLVYVIYVLLAGAELLSVKYSSKFSWLAFLGKGRTKVALAGAFAVAGTGVAVLFAGGGLGAVLGAVIAAIAGYWHSAGVATPSSSS